MRIVDIAQDIAHVCCLALVVLIRQITLMRYWLWLVFKVLNLDVVFTHLVGLVQSLLLLLTRVFLDILLVLGCFATLAEELGWHGLGTNHFLLVWLLIAALVVIFVLDSTLDA